MKAWRKRLEAHVEQWSASHPTSWVPRFVYHFSDVTNVASILRGGALYSRKKALTQKCMAHDQASGTVIAGTQPAHLGYVRLYFRPQTPTQWHNEGIRPPAGITHLRAHCPVPVFLCFDFVETIALDGTLFSDGNMASESVEYGDSEALFARLPFGAIYHRGRMQPPDQIARLTYHRHAEVLVPDVLPLNHKLRWILCRSTAEQRTLLHLLDGRTRAQWSDKIRLASPGIFDGKWWYVTNAHARGKTLTVELHPSEDAYGIKVSYTRALKGGRLATIEDALSAGQTRWVANARDAINSVISIRLDGHLAFQDTVVGTDAPF